MIGSGHDIKTVDDLAESGESLPILMSLTTKIEGRFAAKTDEKAIVDLAVAIAGGGNCPPLVSEAGDGAVLMRNNCALFIEPGKGSDLHDINCCVFISPMLRTGDDSEDIALAQFIVEHRVDEIGTGGRCLLLHELYAEAAEFGIEFQI